MYCRACAPNWRFTGSNPSELPSGKRKRAFPIPRDGCSTMTSQSEAASSPLPATAPQPSVREVLTRPRMLILVALGAASGFPNQVTESALQAWLKDLHISNTEIGMLSYVSLPYLLKFLWAPLLDRFPLPVIGRRRGWILVTQLLLAAAIGVLAFQDPADSLLAVSVCATAIVFFSASQDIVIDAYRADLAEPEPRCLVAARARVDFQAWRCVCRQAIHAISDGHRLLEDRNRSRRQGGVHLEFHRWRGAWRHLDGAPRLAELDVAVRPHAGSLQPR